MAIRCKECEPSTCSLCGFHISDEAHPKEHEFAKFTDLCAKHEFLREVKEVMAKYELLELNPHDRVKVAEEVQKSVSWIRFRAGCDKECFHCRAKNDPEALICVNCKEVIICETCFAGSGNRAWYCAHGGGMSAKMAVIAARVHREEPPPREKEEEPEDRTPPKKRERFTLSIE